MILKRRAAVVCGISIILLAISHEATAGPRGKAVEQVSYKGKIVDEAGRPVSGIFPMTFKLYKGVKTRRALWSEAIWVAVDRGVYTVRLGEQRKLPDRNDMSKLVLGVEIGGLGEVAREPFIADRPPAVSITPPTQEHAGSDNDVKYADTAGYAVEAEHAKNSDRLQNLTIDDITRKMAEEGGSKTVIGKSRRYGERVGGPGGTMEYNEACPRGYVMTGIRGGAGIYLDSIQIVCSPLE